MTKNMRRRVYTTNRLKELSDVLTNFSTIVDHVAKNLNGKPAVVYCGDAPSKAIKTLKLFTENLATHESQTARREHDTARKAARPGKIRDEMTQMMTRLEKLEKELKQIDSF